MIDQAMFTAVIATTLREINTERPDVMKEYRATKCRTDLLCLEERLSRNLEDAFGKAFPMIVYWDAKTVAINWINTGRTS